MDSLHRTFVGLVEGSRGKVLDAGAGEGVLSKALADRGFHVTSCDIEPRDFRHGSCDRVDMNGRLPYSGAQFDFIVCAEVVEHLENPHHLLREFSRVLRRGGTLLISTPNIANVFSRLKFLLTGKFFCFGDDERRLGHLNPLAWWEMEEALRSHGFRVSRIVSNSHLRLSGCDTTASAMKRAAVRAAFVVLGPFMTPKDSELLKGDSLVFVARKVR